MQLFIGIEEVASIVRQYLNLPSNVEIIVGNTKTLLEDHTRRVEQFASHIITLMDGNHKIEAIKEVRNVSGMGLKESKDFVERMDYRYFVQELSRYVK